MPIALTVTSLESGITEFQNDSGILKLPNQNTGLGFTRGAKFRGVMGKANLRLKEPSSHRRLWSRGMVLEVVWAGTSPLVAYLLRDGVIQSPTGVVTYCGIALVISVVVFQWYQTSSPIARFYSIRDGWQLVKACFL